MSPTQASMYVLLGMLMLTHAAHADETGETVLHNDDALADLSVVRNWTLICEHLCSLNLSGPACGLDCQPTEIPADKQQQTEVEIRTEYNFPPEHQSELCETLCDNGLGGKRCTCQVKISPAASSSSFYLSPNRAKRDQICFDFCRFHHFTLRGCSQCPFEGEFYSPLRHRVPKLTTVSPEYVGISGIRENSVSFEPFEAPTDPPTPDWSKLCVTLCRQGSGGILCNCDLAPF